MLYIVQFIITLLPCKIDYCQHLNTFHELYVSLICSHTLIPKVFSRRPRPGALMVQEARPILCSLTHYNNPGWSLRIGSKTCVECNKALLLYTISLLNCFPKTERRKINNVCPVSFWQIVRRIWSGYLPGSAISGIKSL